MADHREGPVVTDTPRKRKINGRKHEKAKKQKVKSHTTGANCHCSRFKCFEVITEEERQVLIDDFNGNYETKDSQDAYLASLIKLSTVKRRRPRDNNLENAKPKDMSVSYTVRVRRGEKSEEIAVCVKAFCSLFGVTKSRLETIRTALHITGHPPQDGRGKHSNRPHALTDETRQLVCDHIASFRGRHSHYAMGETRRVYLPEDLNVTKMHQLFMELNPEIKVGYESYRMIFNTRFNIAFGYPRTDTCSSCDEFIVKLQYLDNSSGEQNVEERERERADLVMAHELHKRKADTFYERKSAAKQRAQRSVEFEAVCFDFAKNLQMPNKSTNDVYYRRQLSLYTFVIHVLSTDQVYLYTYDETVAKKGADDVCSLISDFVANQLSDTVREISFFCDGCSGQNKNYTVLRLMYHLVHSKSRFSTIKVFFPMRGHSYMECDRDFANVNCKKDVELPEDWRKEFASARVKPTPFNVINATQDMFFKYGDFLAPSFKATCPIKTRPVREIHFVDSRPRLIMFRDTWNGGFESAVVTKPERKSAKNQQLQRAYCTPLPISCEKFKDLQVLKRFCSPANHGFFDNLPHVGAGTSAPQDSSDASDADE